MGQIIVRLAGFYGFHWWRVATLRASFELLSDRKENVYVFASLYWSLGLFRWLVLSERHLAAVIISLVFGMAVILALTVKPKQSFSLAAALFASSAAVDLLATFAGLVGLGFASNWPFVFVEVLMYIASLRAFHHARDEIRTRGYKVPSSHL